MTTIVIDGLYEEDFRRSIESRLRDGRVGEAIERLRALLSPYAGLGGLLPERFLTVAATDLTLIGWDALTKAISRHDRPGLRVTGLSIAFGPLGDEASEPDADGRLRPIVETSYFTDEAFPFSCSGREDLLEGYSFYGCTWSGDSIATDTTLSLEGVDDLQGALAKLEAQLLACDDPDEDGIRAGSLGACLLSALLVQAVGERIARDGLPRPLCVMAGSNEVYPYFNAPVVGMTDEAQEAAKAQEELAQASRGYSTPRYSSLLMTGIPRGRKRAVLVLEHGEDDAAHCEPELALIEPELHAPAMEAADMPLLATKRPGQPWDFRDMLGPREPEASRAEPPHRELPGPSDQPLVETRDQLTDGPGIAQLDSEERIQRMLASSFSPKVGAPEPALAGGHGEPAPLPPGCPAWAENAFTVPQADSPAVDSIRQPTSPAAPARFRAWVGSRPQHEPRRRFATLIALSKRLFRWLP